MSSGSSQELTDSVSHSSRSSGDFSVAQKTIHWVMAFLVIAMLIAGQFFNDPTKELADRLWSRAQHGSGGILFGLFLVVRLVLRFRNGAPAEHASTPQWQARLSQASHWGMYVIMAALVISGIAVGMFTTTPMHLPILGGTNISIMHNTDEALYLQVRWYHSLVTDIAIGFVALHVAAAFYHLFIIRDRIMQRMAAFWRSESQKDAVSNLSEEMNK